MSTIQQPFTPVPTEPDFDQLLTVLRGGRPQRPTLFEFFLNPPLYAMLAGRDCDPDDPLDQLAQVILAYRNAGYDYATLPAWLLPLRFPIEEQHRGASISQNEGAVIDDRASLEAYPWPRVEAADYRLVEDVAEHLPPGMKLMGMGPSGVLENVINLVGYERLCYALADGEDWIEEVFVRVGERLVEHYRLLAAQPTIGFCISNDDWGFNSQTLLSPPLMRRLVFPWHRRIVAAVHAAGKPVALHSCGNFRAIIEDVIALGFDARHSYEDKIVAVEEAYQTWGDRIAILGGIDVDFICRSSPEAVYRRSRAMLERSAERGAYALGTGNSVPEWVPVAGYLAMIRAVLETREA